MKQLKVAIVGAGISGLTAAVALHQRGQDVVVFEQADELVEIGAGLSVFANGLRVLERLGVADAVYGAERSEPAEVVIRHWKTGDHIASQDLGRSSCYRREFGHPYLGVMRSHVQRALTNALPPDAIRLGHCLVGFNQDRGGVELTWANGTATRADVLVAADGARSFVREALFGDTTHYSGTSGFRGVVAANDVPSLATPQNGQYWVGPDAHLLHFPVDAANSRVCFLAVTESPRQWPGGKSWRVPCTNSEALEPFQDWHPAVTEMVGAVEHTERWGLFSIGPLARWGCGRVILLGDSAHGMLPHYGQGANQDIEDAYVLADILAHAQSESDLEAALSTYEAARKAKATRVQEASWVASTCLHVCDEEAPSRNARLAAVFRAARWMHSNDTPALVDQMSHHC
ncbi:FAD-dependent oxidoreductase [Pseudonocardia kujensis]|uniref:FAD-dependent oxidoreductase n=1 Tax=Pseudonocardia kujensis TaxID=1128675 RepID=UPI001E42DB3C|nr:FAD-dependent oxidoreductase [Pseudonocardia kujensis]MCE0767381.1 FAD-dependent oxidoreductase [Pseudonocardia kujensis]